MMVEVVEAMIGSGPASRETSASAARFCSSTSGTPSKTKPAPGRTAPASASGTSRTRPAIAAASSAAKKPSRAMVPRVAAISLRASSARRVNSRASRCFRSIKATSCPA
jgi:hypothetical protein